MTRLLNQVLRVVAVVFLALLSGACGGDEVKGDGVVEAGEGAEADDGGGLFVRSLTDSYSTRAVLVAWEPGPDRLPDSRVAGSEQVSGRRMFYKYPANPHLDAIRLVAVEERGLGGSGRPEELLDWADTGSEHPRVHSEDLVLVEVCGHEVWVGESLTPVELLVLHYRDGSMLELRFRVGGVLLSSVVDFVSSVLVDLVWNGEAAFGCPGDEIREAVVRSGLRSEPVVVEPGPTVEELALLGTPVVPLSEIAIDLDVEGSFRGGRAAGEFDDYRWDSYLRVSSIEPPVEFSREQLLDLDERMMAVGIYGRVYGESTPIELDDYLALTSYLRIEPDGDDLNIDIDTEGVMTPAMADALRSQIAAWLHDAGVTSAVLADR